MVFESEKTLKNLPFLFGNHFLLVVTLQPDLFKIVINVVNT